MSLFDLGHLVQTRGVAVESQNYPAFALAVLNSINRHKTGDWGDALPDGKELNDYAVKHGGDRIFSVYNLPTREGNRTVWIITEHDRSVTTVLFSDEY